MYPLVEMRRLTRLALGGDERDLCRERGADEVWK